MNPKKTIMTGLTALVMATASAQTPHHKQISDTTAKNTTKVLTNPYNEVGENNSTVAEDTLYRGDQYGNDHHNLTPSLNNVDGVTFENETAIRSCVSAYMHHIAEQFTFEHIQLLNKNMAFSAELTNLIEESYHLSHGNIEQFANELDAQVGLSIRADLPRGIEFIHTIKGGGRYTYEKELEEGENELEEEGENRKHITNSVQGLFTTGIGVQKKFGEEGKNGIAGGRLKLGTEGSQIYGGLQFFGQYNKGKISVGGDAGYTLSQESLDHPIQGLSTGAFVAMKVKSLIFKVLGGVNSGQGYIGGGISRYPDIKLKKNR